jgi:putative transposase
MAKIRGMELFRIRLLRLGGVYMTPLDFWGGMAMPDYWRNWVPGGTYFFTVALLERKRDLLVAEIELLRESVRRVKRLYPFEIVAWVVLPDHLHCIWSLPEGDADYPKRWRLIKLLFAKGLPKQERLSAVRRRKERGI